MTKTATLMIERVPMTTGKGLTYAEKKAYQRGVAAGKREREDALTVIIKQLESDRARLIEALEKALADINAEFQAMGGDWKDQPIMARKMKNLSAARSLLRELEEPK